ncbi:MAG: TlpA family protein disulfide reductase [Burkholderiaceae bacterium]
MPRRIDPTSSRGLQAPASRRMVLALAGVATADAALAAIVATDARPPREVAPGQVLPDGPLLGLNGPPRRLLDYRGHPLVINVWASWCGPCRAEMASLERLAWRGDRRGFNIIGISTDDDAAAARRLLRSTNATLSHFIDDHLRWETTLGASRLPLTVLADAGGRVVDKVVGAREWDGPEAAVLLDRAFGGAGAVGHRAVADEARRGIGGRPAVGGAR